MNFHQYVKRNTVAVPWSGCMIWTGAVTSGGYGRSAVAQAAHGTTIVHRALYQDMHGPVGKDMYVCHSCDVPACCNPDHLFAGTPSDNASDRNKKGRAASRKGTCSGRALITESDVIDIRARLKDGKRTADIADSFGVSIAAIYQIKHGRTWSHV